MQKDSIGGKGTLVSELIEKNIRDSIDAETVSGGPKWGFDFIFSSLVNSQKMSNTKRRTNLTAFMISSQNSDTLRITHFKGNQKLHNDLISDENVTK